MAHEDSPEEWQAWVEQACKAVGVDPRLVDTEVVLDFTKTVAQRFVRPMAPVAAHILGLAIASHDGVDARRLIEDLERTLPPASA